MAPGVIGSMGLLLTECQRFTLSDAFNSTVRASKRGVSAKEDWRGTVGRFIEWLKANRPSTVYWDLVSRDLVREYLEGLSGLSTNSRRLAVQPLIQTSRFMMREHGAKNDLSGLSPGSDLAKPPEAMFLVDVVDLLEWQRINRPTHEVGTALCGLAGLRVTEALALRWDRVDMEEGLIEIVDGKNAYSNRTIPVAHRVVEALRRAEADLSRNGPSAGVVDVFPNVVLDGHGKPFSNTTAYCRRFVRGRSQWRTDVRFTPKALRKCLPTLGMTEGFWGPIGEQYMGHAAQGVTAKHYVPRLGVRTQGEKNALKKAMEVFRRLVVDRVDRGVEDALGDLAERDVAYGVQ